MIGRLAFAFLWANCLFAEKRPNVLFLFADDQRADTVAAHGNPHVQTPHLDSLAEEGFSFLRNYCAGSFSGAVCVASRAMLMTGRHWMTLPRNDKGNWSDYATLPSLLEKSGNYQTFIIGKWHNGKKTLDQSFANGRSVYMGGMVDHTDFEVQDLSNGKLGDKRPAGGFSSDVFADEAISFIQSATTEKPFFLYVSFMAPHDPRDPPEKHREWYYRNRPPLPQNFLPQHPFQNAPPTTSGRDEGLAPWPRTKETVSDQLCEYYGLITHLDEQVGRILKALGQSRHAENTIVVYTADHGLAMGSHGLLGKQNVYEQSMQCPLIFSGPGIPKGKSSNAFTYVHDLYATLCSLVDITPADEIDSKDLKPIIKGTAREVRKSIFLPFQDNQRSVRDEKWKLHVYPQINHRLLFNLEKDPHEMKDLSNDPQHAEQLVIMERLMQAWRKRLGDPYPLRSDNPSSKKPNYDNSKRILDKWQPKWIREKYFDVRDDSNPEDSPNEKSSFNFDKVRLRLKDLSGNPVKFKQDTFEGDHLKITVERSVSADFDEDGKVDMAMVAKVDSGGSGNFRHLFLLANDGHNLIESDDVFLGDRIRVTNLKSENSQISVNFLDRGKGDSLAAKPYLPRENNYRVQDMRLLPCDDFLQ